MAEFINKQAFKIQVGTFILIIGFVIYWIFIGAGFAYAVSDHEKRLIRMETKMEQLVTKDDLNVMKIDLKDYIKKTQ